MQRTHATVIALVLTVAALAGLFAALRTAHLGAAAQTKVSAAEVARRTHRLDAIEKRLLAEAGRTPKSGAQDAPVVYVRPKPIVHVVHRSGGEREGGHEGRSGFDD